jgi:DMSO/TMAO reductase YedYZ molybdopterin-dependent catalytic subunit
MVGNAEWTGVPLAAVLEEAGVKPGALEVILDGADFGLDEGEWIPTSYSRSIPVELALGRETLLASKMNGVPLGERHGHPLRALVPGWYAMANVKWLRRIEATNRPFRGLYMSKRYYTARRDAVTGEFDISPLREMGVKSQIAFPTNGAVLAQEPCRVRGAAWTGSGQVEKIEVSLDGGKSWHAAALGKERASRAWAFWEYLWESPPAGEHTIAVRAFDGEGRTQPETEDTERVNRYDNRWIHRVRVRVVRGAAP